MKVSSDKQTNLSEKFAFKIKHIFFPQQMFLFQIRYPLALNLPTHGENSFLFCLDLFILNTTNNTHPFLLQGEQDQLFQLNHIRHVPCTLNYSLNHLYIHFHSFNVIPKVC